MAFSLLASSRGVVLAESFTDRSHCHRQLRLPRGTAVGVGEAQEGVGKLVCVNVSFKTLSIEPK